MKYIILFTISLYQKFFSPDHSWIAGFFPYGFCRFYPTCSSYMSMSISKHGVLWGVLRGVVRIIRCNPWNKGGLDPAISHKP